MRVALYERVSTEEQALYGLSIDAQRNALEKWAKDNQHIIVDHYTDAGISARKSAKARPELQRLLADVRAKKIDLIVFTKLDRWFRNVKEYLKVDEVLEANKVAWKAIFEDYETETANGRFKLRIMLDLAELESDRTSERIRTVFDEKKSRGEALSGHAPIGCKIEDKKIVPADDAYKVKDIFDRYLATRSKSQVQREITEIAGKYVTYYGLSYVLKNPVYVNLGIVDKETFDRVQELLKSRSARTPRTNTVYLFTGLCYCAECGAKLSGHRYSDKAGTPIAYFCRNYHQNYMCENTRYIREEAIEKYLLENMVDVCKDYNAEIRAARKKKVDTANIKRKMEKIYDLYMSDLIDKDKYEKDYRKFKQQLAEAERIPREIDVNQMASFMEIYSSLPKEGKREFWNRVIEKIIIDKNKNISFSLVGTVM